MRLFVQQGMAVASAESVGELYAAEKDEDGFLYVVYADSWRPRCAPTPLSAVRERRRMRGGERGGGRMVL